MDKCLFDGTIHYLSTLVDMLRIVNYILCALLEMIQCFDDSFRSISDVIERSVNVANLGLRLSTRRFLTVTSKFTQASLLSNKNHWKSLKRYRQQNELHNFNNDLSFLF